jgi:hypothetical protein
MHTFNLNRTLKFSLASLWSGLPYSYNSGNEMFVFLFDGSEGVPSSADDVFPNAGNPSTLDNFQNYAKNCIAYGIVSGQTGLTHTTDTGYRAVTEYLALKHPVIKPSMAGFSSFTNVSVTVPEHIAYTADWINCTGTGTGLSQPTIQTMCKMFALNPSVSKLSNPYIGLGFDHTTAVAGFESILYVFNEPITTDCFIFQHSKQGASSNNTFNRYAVQYWNGSAWVTLGTSPVITAENNTEIYSNRFLQFAAVTSDSFRLLRTTAKTGVRNELYRNGYFGNTDISDPGVFTYPSTVYGLVVPNASVYGQVNFQALASGLSNGLNAAGATPSSRSLLSASMSDYAGTPTSRRNMPSFLCDCSDLAGSGRIKLPTLNTDATDYFGFNSLVIELL